MFEAHELQPPANSQLMYNHPLWVHNLAGHFTWYTDITVDTGQCCGQSGLCHVQGPIQPDTGQSIWQLRRWIGAISLFILEPIATSTGPGTGGV